MLLRDNITFRTMTEEDLHLLEKWLNTPEVYKFFNGTPMSMEEIEKKYIPRIQGHSQVIPYVFILNGKPAGYLQKYKYQYEEAAKWRYTKEESVVGVDCFIGEPILFNKGIGTFMVQSFVEEIIQQDQPDFIVLDPSIGNQRAIRCYEKAGFSTKLKIKKGNALLMEYKCHSD